MNKEHGNQIIQYVIIIALVALAVGSVFFILGSNLVTNFTNFYNIFSNKANENNNQVASNDSLKSQGGIAKEEIKSGSMGGTPDIPVKKCENNFCTIDYGEFVLQGVPDHFTEFVRTTGSSGGTQTLVNLLDQIIDQMEGEINPDSLQKAKELSNLSHMLADYESQLEQYADNCKNSSDPKACIADIFAQKYYPSSEFAAIYPDINLNGDSYAHTDLGSALNFYQTKPEEFEKRKNTDLPFAIVDSFNGFKDDDGYTDVQKAVITELYRQISSMGQELDDLFYAAKSDEVWSYTYYDPVTGESSPMTIENITLDDITNPEFSKLTDIDASLICLTGQNQDINGQCN